MNGYVRKSFVVDVSFAVQCRLLLHIKTDQKLKYSKAKKDKKTRENKHIAGSKWKLDGKENDSNTNTIAINFACIHLISK